MSAKGIFEFVLSLRALDAEIAGLRAESEMLWLARARPREINVALSYYGELRARLRTAIDWLGKQHQTLPRGDPTESDMSTCDAGGNRTLWQDCQVGG